MSTFYSRWISYHNTTIFGMLRSLVNPIMPGILWSGQIIVVFTQLFLSEADSLIFIKPYCRFLAFLPALVEFEVSYRIRLHSYCTPTEFRHTGLLTSLTKCEGLVFAPHGAFLRPDLICLLIFDQVFTSHVKSEKKKNYLSVETWSK